MTGCCEYDNEPLVYLKTKSFLISWATVSLLKSNLLYGILFLSSEKCKLRNSYLFVFLCPFVAWNSALLFKNAVKYLCTKFNRFHSNRSWFSFIMKPGRNKTRVGQSRYSDWLFSFGCLNKVTDRIWESYVLQRITSTFAIAGLAIE